MVRFLTAGESHGRALVVILEGIPAGLSIDIEAITADLRRRQGGYGRGRRMAIESDRADILSGVRAGETIGGPIAMSIENRDWVNWQSTMRTTAEAPADAGGARRAPVTKPRPGHADLAGVAKYGRADVRRTSARPCFATPPFSPPLGRGFVTVRAARRFLAGACRSRIHVVYCKFAGQVLNRHGNGPANRFSRPDAGPSARSDSMRPTASVRTRPDAGANQR